MSSYIANPCPPLPTMVTLGTASQWTSPPWTPSTFCTPGESCQEPPSSNSKALITQHHTLGVPDGPSTVVHVHRYGTHVNIPDETVFLTMNNTKAPPAPLHLKYFIFIYRSAPTIE